MAMNYYNKIDGLRGFLVMYVALFHLKHWVSPLSGHFAWLQKFIENGGISPFYFFIISGFLIMNSYLYNAKANSINFKTYYIRRFFRIFPVLWVAILLSLLFNIFPFSEEVIKNAFLISFLVPYSFENIPVFVSWSIFVEETYYLVTPLIAKRMNLLIAFLGLVFFIYIQDLFIHHKHKFYDFKELRWDMPFTTFSYFFGGIFIYFLNIKHFFKEKFWPRLNGVLIDIITILLFFQVIVTNGEGLLLTGSFLLLTTLIDTSLIGSLIWNLKVLRYLGTRCYSIYLTHFISIYVAHMNPLNVLNSISLNGNVKIFFQYFWIILFVVINAEIVYRLIERPWIQVGKSLTLKD